MGVKEKFNAGCAKAYDGYTEVDRGWLDKSDVNMHSWGNVKSIHTPDYCSKSHTTRDATKKIVDIGSDIFSTATDNGLATIAHSAATSGTVVLEGVGVAAVPLAGAVALGKSVAAGVSVYKTHQHINSLQDIRDAGSNNIFCEGDRNDHNVIYTHVLPYIIDQKKRKLRRKAEQVVPVLGSAASSIETGLHSIWKRAKGTRGVQRHYYAQVLTVHLVGCKCGLAEDIVSALWGYEKMCAIRGLNSDDAGYYIFKKMAAI